jgi:hypothetical protein
LQDPAFAVQLSSYQLLRRVIDKHVSDLVVEAELDVEDKLEIRLPPALVTALEHVPDVDEPSQVRSHRLVLVQRPMLTLEILAPRSGHHLLAELASHL